MEVIHIVIIILVMLSIMQGIKCNIRPELIMVTAIFYIILVYIAKTHEKIAWFILVLPSIIAGIAVLYLPNNISCPNITVGTGFSANNGTPSVVDGTPSVVDGTPSVVDGTPVNASTIS